MSFGSSGFGGFGQNKPAQPTGFGGFGTSSTTTPAFGSSGQTAFGAGSTTGTGGMFGSTTGTTGFGANTGGFGQNTGSAFGAAKPAFGATSTAGGSLFGASTATAGGTGGFGGGGFGSTTTPASTSFGATGGGSLFGANKPTGGFGSTTTPAAGTSLFGSSGGGAFGSTSAGGFGANNPGIGTNIGDAPGTAQVPFTATVEKEANQPQNSNSYQNILFMDPYTKWSADELRLADYNQGRRHGNATGGGAFGVNSFGGGNAFGTNTTQQSTPFGSTTTASTGLFGANQPQAATGGFGSTQPTTGAFGSGGNLFGANKPAATGGMFGSGATSQPAQSGGLFGSTGNNAFGTTSNTGSTFGANTGGTGTSLFGANTAQNKPSGFSFGNTGTASAFGGNTGTQQNAFGQGTAANTGTGLFGNTGQANTGGNAFGSTGQQNTGAFGTGSTFGAQNQSTGGGLFGNQNKPAGAFGATGTGTGGGGLFGSTSTATPFGATNTQTQGGGLFGPKPATTGTNAFGGLGTAGQTGSTGGGLFSSLGSNTQTQQQPSSLFGNMGQNQAQKPSPFSNSGQATGGGIFGAQNQQQSTGMFGNTTQQQPQFAGSTNSLFGASQNSQAPQSLSTSINDISAYGSASLFSNLGNAEPQNPGPLATPLSSKSKTKTRSILPMYKLSPANASRFATPQKRGYGFSYSTYGTPTTPSSVASTPGGLGQSLLAGSIGRGLGKSISTSNLRRSFNVEDSILTPGAFSASSSVRLGGTGGHKKLVINRDMRSDLFNSPSKDKQVQDIMNSSRKLTKRVSFDTSVPAIENGTQEKENTQPADGSPAAAKDLGYLRPSAGSAANTVNGSARQAPAPEAPEMEQVKGNELAIVHEEEAAAPVARQRDSGMDKDPGAYWMHPTKESILDMNRMQRQKVADFTVGRENVGSVRFKVPVDLNGIDLDQLFNTIVILEPRSATVYPVSAKKPPVGKGLNVPAQISLEQSWPRAKDKRTLLQDKNGSRFNKHIERLKRIPDTTFDSYDKDTGVWTFSVEHFTTYGLDYDEEDTEAEGATETSNLSAPNAAADAAETTPSPELNPDDTFDFKQGRRALPGAFDGTAFSDDEEMAESDQMQRARSPVYDDEPEAHDDVTYHQGATTVMGGFQGQGESPDVSFEDGSPAAGAVEVWRENAETARDVQFREGVSMAEDQNNFQLSNTGGNEQVPGGIMRARMRAMKKSTAPTHIQVAGGDDWTQVLQASVRTPRRMNRAELRALNESGAAWESEDRGTPVPKPQNVSDTAGFSTSIDMMKSLFEKAPAPQPTQATTTKGFVQWPYQRRSKIAHAEEETDRASRNSPPVSWGPGETIVTASNNLEAATAGRITIQSADLEGLAESPSLQTYIDMTNITVVNKVPAAKVDPSHTIKSLATNGDVTWELASVLFDDAGENLSAFWQRLVDASTNRAVADALTPEAKAVACLAGHRVADACKYLLDSKNFRLATLVSTIGSDEQTKKDIRTQIQDWQKSNVLADFSEPIRAIYELLAGNTSTCAGVKGVPIENRVSSFVISDRFDLDWMQSFGLRLWYGTSKTIAEAVASFQHDINQDREAEPDSALWSLLKCYADAQVDYSDYRLDWLLGRAIYATGQLSWGQKADEKLDAATISFASQLTATGNWVSAAFVLLHLSDPMGRSKAIRDLVGRHAHLIPTEKKTQEGVFATLTQKFKIPAKWIWEAKAMQARAVDKDPVAEFSYLILAEDFLEANRTFLKRVAPAAVIQRKYTELFEYAKLLYHIRDKLPNWASGAGVYLLFPATRNWSGAQLPEWTDELAHGLRALKAATSEDDILEVAAIADMAEDLVRVGVEVHRKGGDPKLYKLAMALPLTEDRKQKYVKDLVFEGMAQIGVH